MRDDEAMEQALAAGAAARRRTAPNPWVGCALVRDGEIVGMGATEPPGGAARRGRRAGPGRRPRPRRDRLRHARAVLAPRAHPALRRRAGRRPASRVSSPRSRIPTHGSRAPGSRGCGPPGIDVTVGVGAERADARAGALPASPPHRPAVRGGQGRVEHRRPRRRGRRIVAVAHRRPRPAPTRTSCAPTRRRSWSARAPRSPISRSSPCATSRSRPSIRRRGCCSTRAVGFPRPVRCSTHDSRRRSSSPPNASADARSTRGARPGRRSSRSPRPPTATASTSTRRSRCSAAKACSRCSSKGGGTLLGSDARR